MTLCRYIYLHLQRFRVKNSSACSIQWPSVECLFTIFPLLSAEVDWRVQAVRHRPGWLDPGFIWTVSIHGLQYSITHTDHHRRAQLDTTVPKLQAPPRMSAMVDTTRFFLNPIFSPSWAVSHKFRKWIQENFQDKEPSVFWVFFSRLIVFVWRYNYSAWCVKRNLVVFCWMTNLNYVCVGVGEYYGHILSFCLSVCLSLSTNFLMS